MLLKISFFKGAYSKYRNGQRNKVRNYTNDIDRKVHGLMRRFQSRASKLKINLNPQVLLNGSPWDPLNQAIWDAIISKIQTEQTYLNKLNCWKKIFLFFKVPTKTLFKCKKLL